MIFAALTTHRYPPSGGQGGEDRNSITRKSGHLCLGTGFSSGKCEKKLKRGLQLVAEEIKTCIALVGSQGNALESVWFKWKHGLPSLTTHRYPPSGGQGGGDRGRVT